MISTNTLVAFEKIKHRSRLMFPYKYPKCQRKKERHRGGRRLGGFAEKRGSMESEDLGGKKRRRAAAHARKKRNEREKSLLNNLERARISPLE